MASGRISPANSFAPRPILRNWVSVMGCRRTPPSEAASAHALIWGLVMSMLSGTSSSSTPASGWLIPAGSTGSLKQPLSSVNNATAAVSRAMTHR